LYYPFSTSQDNTPPGELCVTHDDHEDHDDPSAIDGRSATLENQQAFQIGHSEGASESITSERCNGKLSSSALVVLQQRIMKPNTWATWAVVSNHVQVNGAAARGVVAKKALPGVLKRGELVIFDLRSSTSRSPAGVLPFLWSGMDVSTIPDHPIIGIHPIPQNI
jgi:hypothetical protein